MSGPEAFESWIGRSDQERADLIQHWATSRVESLTATWLSSAGDHLRIDVDREWEHFLWEQLRISRIQFFHRSEDAVIYPALFASAVSAALRTFLFRMTDKTDEECHAGCRRAIIDLVSRTSTISRIALELLQP